MKFKSYKYQDYTSQYIIDHPSAGIFQDMGLGKTVSTLTAIEWLMYQEFDVHKVLVIAPLNVCALTWPEELKKWDHLKHLRYSLILGTEAERRAAIRKPADIYIINCENVVWLVSHYQTSFKYDMLVIDESSKFKNHDSKRFKALKQVIPKFKRVVALTGTPTANGLLNLWSQLYLLDRGERLGKNITAYREAYFGRNFNGFGYKISDGCEGIIKDKIKDICISMKTEDYIDLPPRIDRYVRFKLSAKVQEKYDDFEKDQILEILLASGESKDVAALTKATLAGKLLQFAGGAVYDEDKFPHRIHDEKLDMLSNIIEEAQGKPVLIFYSYIHELDRIKKRFPQAVVFKGSQRHKQEIKDQWDQGEVEIMICHPASAGHGLNLQAGGSIIVWYALTWDLEFYQQGNKRLHRSGQKEPVIIHHLIAENTMDQDVMTALESKNDLQESFMLAIKARIEKYKAFL